MRHPNTGNPGLRACWPGLQYLDLLGVEIALVKFTELQYVDVVGLELHW